MPLFKPQELPGTLWVVATPIGNLSDVTERAKAALSEAEIVFCEDTRQGAKLFSALAIPRADVRLERLDAHTPEAKVRAWAERIATGGQYALISDAGTPGISDPGAALVKHAREAGARAVPIPGASAVMALLSVSGFEETAFVFRGFFPRKAGERSEEIALARASLVARVFVWFESPNRIVEALESLAQTDPSVDVVAAKELTKMHERFFSGDAQEVCAKVSDEISREGERGEWCFAVKFALDESRDHSRDAESSEWVKALHCLLDARVSASEAARQVSQHFGAPRKTVYELALKISGKKI